VQPLRTGRRAVDDADLRCVAGRQGRNDRPGRAARPEHECDAGRSVCECERESGDVRVVALDREPEVVVGRTKSDRVDGADQGRGRRPPGTRCGDGDLVRHGDVQALVGLCGGFEEPGQARRGQIQQVIGHRGVRVGLQPREQARRQAVRDRVTQEAVPLRDAAHVVVASTFRIDAGGGVRERTCRAASTSRPIWVVSCASASGPPNRTCPRRCATKARWQVRP
jgi:hypothetical protein